MTDQHDSLFSLFLAGWVAILPSLMRSRSTHYKTRYVRPGTLFQKSTGRMFLMMVEITCIESQYILYITLLLITCIESQCILYITLLLITCIESQCILYITLLLITCIESQYNYIIYNITVNNLYRASVCIYIII